MIRKYCLVKALGQLAGFTFLSFFHTLHTGLRTHAATHAATSDSLPLRADLQYSHISLVSPLCPLFSLSLFAGSLALSGLIGARGYRGLPALRGACFAALMSFSWLPVRAGPEPHRPARPEKKARGDPFAHVETKNSLSHFA